MLIKVDKKSIKASWNVIICLLCKLAYSLLVLYKQIMTRLEYEPRVKKYHWIVLQNNIVLKYINNNIIFVLVV